MAGKYDYLLALKVGETKSFPNASPRNRSPSSRYMAMKMGTALRALERENPGSKFVQRLSPNGSKVIVMRISDGVTSCPSPPRSSTTWLRGKGEAITTLAPTPTPTAPFDVKAYDFKIAAATGTKVGKSWWIVTGGWDVEVFDDQDDANECASLLTSPQVIEVREI